MQTLYPKTSSEYAQQLNAKVKPGTWGGKLSTDPEHWSKYGVHTGKQLAHYLLASQHNDLYKSVYGTRPRHIDYKSISAEDLEAEIEELLTMAKHQNEAANHEGNLRKIIKEELGELLKEASLRSDVEKPFDGYGEDQGYKTEKDIEEVLIKLNKASMANRIPAEAADHPKFAYTLGYQRALKDVAEKLLGIIF